jgi:hypothetical protein
LPANAQPGRYAEANNKVTSLPKQVPKIQNESAFQVAERLPTVANNGEALWQQARFRILSQTPAAF